MDWNPADEFSGRDPSICEACDGSGEIIFAIWVHEPGCGYGHESSDGRMCEECNGTGRVGREPRPLPVNLSHQQIIPDDDLPF